MGIHTVAVYSEVDAAAAHVLEADEAVLLGESEPSKSYLNIERIIAVAKSTGAEAIHPGYGFLAENSGFAECSQGSGKQDLGPPDHGICRCASNSRHAGGVTQPSALAPGS
jgi:acetyl/propionyl-CoA carboxylase alpha subunit